jgi:hypothetical protein
MYIESDESKVFRSQIVHMRQRAPSGVRCQATSWEDGTLYMFRNPIARSWQLLDGLHGGYVFEKKKKDPPAGWYENLAKYIMRTGLTLAGF